MSEYDIEQVASDIPEINGWVLVLVGRGGVVSSLEDLDPEMLTNEETGETLRVFSGEIGDPLYVVGPFTSAVEADAERERLMLADLIQGGGDEPMFDGYVFPLTTAAFWRGAFAEQVSD